VGDTVIVRFDGRATTTSGAPYRNQFVWIVRLPGALPTLFAATSPDARKGGYYGPDRLSETRGFPSEAKPPAVSLDAHAAGRLWDLSETLTGVTFADPEALPASVDQGAAGMAP
jgi:hypothetical protein